MKKICLATLISLMLMIILNAIPIQAVECPSVPTWQYLNAGYGRGTAAPVEVVGKVFVSTADNTLVVTYETMDGWELTETHLYVGTMPPTKSAPGQFPYKHPDLPGGTTSDEYEIPLSELDTNCVLYIAAHAVVRKLFYDGCCPWWWEETAWTCGEPFGKNWAKYFCVTIPCCIP